MPRRIAPFGFSYRFDYVPAGKRKTVSTELEGSAFAAIEEIAPEDAPLAIRVTDNLLHGKDFPFCIRACGRDLLWPVLNRDDSYLTADTFLRALVEGTAFPGPYGHAPYSLKQRQLYTIEGLRVRRRDYQDFDEQVARMQRRVAQLRICEGKIWIVGAEPVYVRQEEHVQLVKPPSPRNTLTALVPLADEHLLFDLCAVDGDVFSLDELELAFSGASNGRKSKPFAEVRGWRARTDPVQLQLRAILSALVSSFLLCRITELPPDARNAIGWIDSLNRADALPTVEESAAALLALADLCGRNQEVAALIGDAWHFILTSMDSVVRNCSLRSRQSPFRLSDADERALSSLEGRAAGSVTREPGDRVQEGRSQIHP